MDSNASRKSPPPPLKNSVPSNPPAIAPLLAEGLKATRDLLAEVNASHLVEPGKSDVAFELNMKQQQFEKALALALEVSFDAVVAPEKEPDNRFGGAQSVTFSIAIPGQKFFVQTTLHNEGSEKIGVEDVVVRPSDGKDWNIQIDKPAVASLIGKSEEQTQVRCRCASEMQLLPKPSTLDPIKSSPITT